MARENETGTCSVCRRRRKMVGPPDPKDGSFHYFYLCRECTALSPEERDAEKDRGERRVEERNLKSRKAYPIVGGPLDGEFALTIDFQSAWGTPGDGKFYREGGMYAHLSREYFEYNSASRGNPSMIFVHESCLPRQKRGRQR